MIVEKEFNNGEVTLNYAEGPDAGPPLLFLHGLTDRWQFFLPMFPQLSERWHVYALDFRGHGKSSRSPPYRYLDHIKDTIAFIERKVGEKVIIYGTALGAMVSLMVAARRPDLVKALIFGDANIKIKHVRAVMANYHTFWSGWERIAGLDCSLDVLVREVAEMPIDIPWRPPGKYGDGLDYIAVLNKALYLKHLDSKVLTPWAKGGTDDNIFKEVTTGYDEKAIKDIECPVLLIQGNPEKGAILTDDEVEYAKERIRNMNHIYLPEYGHNLGCYSYEAAGILRVINAWLESFR
ncbi:MAG: alpha/beta hydrolase [Candidatus Bathyarchaeota archaeon]|nr:alpha/beta hydrolase [Candidatus Bathyarchaeota archaeon]